MKRCKWCNKPFKPPTNKNAAKYCSQKCRKKAYQKRKQKYRRKRMGTMRKCAWCGEEFLSTNGFKYCSKEHRKYARQEQKLRYSIQYAMKGLSEKQQYFKYLGTSNLRKHRNTSFKDEQRLVRAEKRRVLRR